MEMVIWYCRAQKRFEIASRVVITKRVMNVAKKPKAKWTVNSHLSYVNLPVNLWTVFSTVPD